MKICENCVYYDKLISTLETKKQKKKVIYCACQNKFIEVAVIKKMSKCDYSYPKKPD